MKKRISSNIALALVAIAVLVGVNMLSGSGTSVRAGDPTPEPSSTPTPTATPTPTPTPTPSPSGTPCSPGYWKNHQSLWYGPDYCGLSSAETLCNLKPQCNNDPAARQEAATCLNEIFNCTE